MSSSGTVTVVIHVGDYADEASVVAVFGCRERQALDVLSDVEWFEEKVHTAGLDDMLDLSDPHRPVQPGFWLVQGHCWEEHIHSVNGDDYDGGFEVEQFDPLPTDLLQAMSLIGEAVGVDGEDMAVAMAFAGLLQQNAQFRQDGQTRLGNLMGLLTVLTEIAGV
jgi:hypothetical protein